MNLTRRKTLKRLTRYLSAACLAFTATAQAATVDLLVLYDQYSSDYFSGDPQTAMANWVNQMNAAYSDSQIDLQLRLVGVRHNEEVGADMGEVLNNLRQNNAVQSLRNQLGADFVSQMHSTGACGVGYVAVDPNWTWNVVHAGCGPMVMAHELGHNMGLNHSRRQGDTGGIRFGYGVGYGVDNVFVDIMAYEGVFNTTRVNRFSNPNLTCRGYPCGVPVGDPQEAYGALAIHNVRDEIAAFRPTAGTSGPVVVSEHCDFGGYSVGLPAGNYDLAELNRRGILNDDISSIRVQSGYKADLFTDNGFAGNLVSKTGDDNCLVDDGINDLASSLIVSTTGGFSHTLQAENYFSSAGVDLETTSDTGGGQNVGWIDTGDWMAYNGITFPESGNYTVEYRVASLDGGGRLSLDLNGGETVLGELALPTTGGWQSWTTVSQTVNVQAGTYNLGIYAQAGGWNLNWIRISR
ncbi:carbohydrate-binding protein [Microbulbifer halophilus]|uniref:Carbohydrate-binding protein n=1 Tax=Microbulbifer halophilus TaxID=453963 RepID=A0ABW5EC21_9GAMM|nr:carbohydrate-binding protein [Microbulbifer halophilus]MCW8126450.1 carbohydrate-binding protein [Microbulbifer halophilus]